MTTFVNRQRVRDARMTLNSDTIEMDGLDVAIIDQLTNLRHMAQHHGLDWDMLINTATGHYKHEQGEIA